jgi:hypothetical protein
MLTFYHSVCCYVIFSYMFDRRYVIVYLYKVTWYLPDPLISIYLTSPLSASYGLLSGVAVTTVYEVLEGAGRVVILDHTCNM